MVAAGALEAVPNADEVKKANSEDSVAAASINDVLYAYPMTADNGYFLYYDKRCLSDTDVQTMDGLLAAADSTQILVGDMENITGHMNENQQIASDLKKETEVFKKL